LREEERKNVSRMEGGKHKIESSFDSVNKKREKR